MCISLLFASCNLHFQLDEAKTSVKETIKEKEQAAVDHQVNRTQLITVLDNYKSEQDKIVWDLANQNTQLKQELEEAHKKV